MRQGKAICFVALATLTLLVPALINRSPFVFYDARHYLELGRSLIRPLHMDSPLIAVAIPIAGFPEIWSQAIMQPAIAAWLGLPWNDAWRWIAPPVSGAMAGLLAAGLSSILNLFALSDVPRSPPYLMARVLADGKSGSTCTMLAGIPHASRSAISRIGN